MTTVSEIDEMTRADGVGRPTRLCALLVPVGLLAMSLVLPHFMFASGKTGQVRVGLGPAAWPDGILTAMGGFAVLWLFMELRGRFRGSPVAMLQGPGDEQTYAYGKAVLGIGLILAYGWLLDVTGFAIATSVFLVIWCLYGGIRNPWLIAPVSLVGTGVLLWVFMGLALMPLSRGVGIFDDFSVWVLQTLRIY